ncbi:MAG: HEAT repeat domain-containing protein [Candidatus Poribacteria bacterium]|nr:HEAT repeat domain-containing protein [Candidatus Poribacteria bacterium]
MKLTNSTVTSQYLLGDEQIRHFIVNGYVNVTADVPTHIHETIYDKTDELFDGSTDFRGDRQHNPLNNILPLVPELQVVLESPEVRGALTSILGNGYVMHPHRHCHPNFAGSTPSGKEDEERLMMPLHKDGHAGGKRPRHRTPRWAILFYYPQPCLAEQGPTCIIPGTQYLREFMLGGERQRHEIHAAAGNGTRRLSEDFLNRNLVPMSGELGTVWIMHFDMVHSFLQNYVPLNRYGMKFVFMRTEQPTAPSWNSETSLWQPPEVNHVPYDAEILWTYIWNWMSGKTDLYETARPDTTMDTASAIAALKADDPNERMKAANELGFWRSLQAKTCSKNVRTDAAAVVSALVDALEDSYEPVRRNAIYALGAIGEPAVKPLANALDSEKEAFDMEPILHICDAAHGLAATGAPAVSELITALQDERENVRASAAYALGEMGPVAAEAVDTLIALLRDESAEVRRHATSALGMIKVPVSKTVPALVEVLEDREDTDLAFFAAQALTRIGPDATEAIPALREALTSESAYVRGFSSEALGRIGTAEALQALVPFLRTARWFNYVKKTMPAFSIELKDAKSAPSDADSLTKLIQEWAKQKDIPLPETEAVSKDSDTQFQVTFSDGRQVSARVEGNVLNLYRKTRVEAGFKTYR